MRMLIIGLLFSFTNITAKSSFVFYKQLQKELQFKEQGVEKIKKIMNELAENNNNKAGKKIEYII